MTVLVAARQLSAAVALEAREACRALALEPIDWVRGIPRTAPLAVISGLPHGERRIPEELIALLEATPALHLVLCAHEPLIKPRVLVGDGRVCVLGPPVARDHIAAALRAAMAPPPPPIAAPHDRRFEVLRRSHWIAWTRGRTGPAISLHEQRGATVVVGDAARDRAAIADAMTSTQIDDERAARLVELAGEAGVAHLTHDAHEWVMYWPFERGPLWIVSPHRVPARWNAARGIAAVAQRRLLRMPAFAGDQLIAAWSEDTSAHDLLGPQHTTLEGGSETIVALDALVGGHDDVAGLVMEVR